MTCFCLATLALPAQELAKADVYGVAELAFEGSPQTARQSPAKDVDFWVRIRHQSGSPEYRIQGFWDGGASGTIAGISPQTNVFGDATIDPATLAVVL